MKNIRMRIRRLDEEGRGRIGRDMDKEKDGDKD